MITVSSVPKVRKHYYYSGSAGGKTEVLICVHFAGVNGFIDNPESELSCNLTTLQHFTIIPGSTGTDGPSLNMHTVGVVD